MSQKENYSNSLTPFESSINGVKPGNEGEVTGNLREPLMKYPSRRTPEEKAKLQKILGKEKKHEERTKTKEELMEEAKKRRIRKWFKISERNKKVGKKARRLAEAQSKPVPKVQNIFSTKYKGGRGRKRSTRSTRRRRRTSGWFF